MTSVVFYFQVHQPFRLRPFTFFDIGAGGDYFADGENERIFRRVAEKCYLPMNALLERLIEESGGRFRCAFSISGTALDQMELWSPETLESFRRLARTGSVEMLAETSHHSLASIADDAEFREQVESHRRRIARLFGRLPQTLRNTELVCSNTIARTAEELGFSGMLAEGADRILEWRSPHRVYRPEGCERLGLLLRSYRLSDDIAFRFGNRAWGEWPLTAERFASWIHALPEEERVVGLFMDYETFGEHQWAETGIFSFMEQLPAAVLGHSRFRFATPAEVISAEEPVASLNLPRPVSWADTERDLTAWLENPLQQAAHQALYDLRQAMRVAPGLAADERRAHLECWRRLSTSDHLYYMCTKYFADGEVHKYFSPYSAPEEAFIAFMNVIDDLSRRVEAGATRAARPAERTVTRRPAPARESARDGSRRAPDPRGAVHAP